MKGESVKKVFYLQLNHILAGGDTSTSTLVIVIATVCMYCLKNAFTANGMRFMDALSNGKRDDDKALSILNCRESIWGCDEKIQT